MTGAAWHIRPGSPGDRELLASFACADPAVRWQTEQGTDTYGTTAVIATESALRLAGGEAKPGVLAPAQAYDPADFLNTLAEYGIHYTIG
jgi:hypothetical protein